MSLASIPWLMAIFSALGKIAHWLLGQTKALLFVLGLFLKDLIKWVASLIKKWGVYKFGLLTALSTLAIVGVRSAIQLIPEIRSIKTGWQSLMDMCPGLSWLLWNSDGPIRLVEFFEGMQTTLSVYIVLASAQFIIRKLRWEIQVALGMKLGSGGGS